MASSQRTFLWLASSANAYFWLQVLIAYWQLRHVLVGVFTELLTIPAFLALAISSVGLIVLLVRGRVSRAYRPWAFVVLASTAALIAIAATA